MTQLGRLIRDDASSNHLVRGDVSVQNLVYVDSINLTLGGQTGDRSYVKSGTSSVYYPPATFAGAVAKMEAKAWALESSAIKPRVFAQNIGTENHEAQCACGRFDISARGEVGSRMVSLKITVTTLFGDALTWRICLQTSDNGTPDNDYAWATGAATQFEDDAVGLQTITFGTPIVLKTYLFFIFTWETYTEPPQRPPNWEPDSTDVALEMTGYV